MERSAGSAFPSAGWVRLPECRLGPPSRVQGWVRLPECRAGSAFPSAGWVRLPECRARQTGAGPSPGPPRASLEGLRGPPKAPLEGLRKAKGLPWKAFGLPPRRGCDSSFCRALPECRLGPPSRVQAGSAFPSAGLGPPSFFLEREGAPCFFYFVQAGSAFLFFFLTSNASIDGPRNS